jgi:hypothetical protein
MRETIKNAFKNDGLFGLMRDEDRLADARLDLLIDGEFIENLHLNDHIVEQDPVDILLDIVDFEENEAIAAPL